MPDFKLISADSHVNEPPAAWERVQKEYGERAPKVVKDPPGVPKGTWLVTDGLPPFGCSHFSIGRVVDKPQGISQVEFNKHFEAIKFNETFRYEDYPGGWEPSARLKDQDTDGVEAEILFSSPGRFFYGLEEEPFQRSILRSYNAWLHEFCRYTPRRLVGLPLVSILDVDHTVADVNEYGRMGFKGFQIPTGIKGSGYWEPKYEPMWAAAEANGMVINVHTTSTQGEKRTHFEGPREVDPWRQPIGFASRQAHAQQFMGSLIFSGVFDRHPNLKVACAEFDVGWVANIVQQCDYWYGRQSTYDSEKNINKEPPSTYFSRNIFFTFQDDRAGMLTAPVYGADNYLWASDYPHGVTTWPNSGPTLDANCAGLDESIKRRVGRDNAIQLYGLELPLASEAERVSASRA